MDIDIKFRDRIVVWLKEMAEANWANYELRLKAIERLAALGMFGR